MRVRQNLQLLDSEEPAEPAPALGNDIVRALEALPRACELARQLRELHSPRNVVHRMRNAGLIAELHQQLLDELDQVQPVADRFEAIVHQPIRYVLANPADRQLLQGLTGRRS
jgi:hypothetical protein